ncbi:MAG: helix-turn-helix domain-containing protein [Halobacteriota archaeon]
MAESIATETESIERLDLRAELAWDIPEDTSCPLAIRLDENPKGLTIHHSDGTCYMEVELVDCPDGSACERLKLQETVDNCSCPVFWQNGCHPRFRIVEDMLAIAEVYLTDRRALRELVSDLRASGRDPRIRNLTIAGGGEDIAEFRATNVGDLTEREKECIEFAVREGYYDREQKITLQDVADEFDVSKSTCSERLGSVESKIVKSLFEQ